MGKNTKAVSNEVIIAALLQHGTIKEAAAAAGTTSRTIYDRMKDNEFRAEYKAAKCDIIRTATINVTGKLGAAIDAVAEIMNDPEVNPAVRLQAAQTIINNAGKIASRLDDEEAASIAAANPLIGFF